MKIIFILLISIFISCGNQGKIPPKAVNGVLDLRDWDFEKDGVINLDGEWEFYWETFPEGDNLNLPETIKSFIFVPKDWNGNRVSYKNNKGVIEEKEIEGEGYATYKINLILKENSQFLEMLFPIEFNSYEVYVNNVRIHKIGELGKNKEQSIPKWSRKYTILDKDQLSNNIQIKILISNFDHTLGGLVNPIVLGSVTKIGALQSSSLAIDLFICGILFIMGMYHLALFNLRNEDKSTLYFGLICLLLAFRTTLTGEAFYYDLFPEATYALSLKFEYLTYYIVVPLFYKFLEYLFKSEFNDLVSKIVYFISFILILIVILLPPIFFSKTLLFIQIFTVTNIFIIFKFLISAILHKRDGAGFVIIGFFIFVLTIINDILHNNFIINTGLYTPAGLVFFIFAQSYLLSARFSKAFQDAKDARKLAEEQRQLVVQSKEEIERLGRAKDEFLANLSHEIKTPLVTIYGYSELIAMDGEIPETTKEYGSEIYKSAGKLNSYMDDVLLVTDLETNLELKKEDFELRDLVEEMVQNLDSMASEKNIVWNSDQALGKITCDRVLFSRALGNIMKNAIVYNQNGGNVTIRSSKKSGIFIIEIQDDGIGISEAYHQKIFEKFFRVDSSLSYEVSGVGLGLFLSKRIIDLHGGSIKVNSSLGKGSTFEILCSWL